MRPCVCQPVPVPCSFLNLLSRIISTPLWRKPRWRLRKAFEVVNAIVDWQGASSINPPRPFRDAYPPLAPGSSPTVLSFRRARNRHTLLKKRRVDSRLRLEIERCLAALHIEGH